MCPVLIRWQRGEGTLPKGWRNSARWALQISQAWKSLLRLSPLSHSYCLDWFTLYQSQLLGHQRSNSPKLIGGVWVLNFLWALCPSSSSQIFKQSLKGVLQQRKIFNVKCYIINVMGLHFTDVETENRDRWQATILWHMVELSRLPWGSTWKVHCCLSYEKTKWYCVSVHSEKRIFWVQHSMVYSLDHGQGSQDSGNVR